MCIRDRRRAAQRAARQQAPAFTAHQPPHHMRRNKPHKTPQPRKASSRACPRRRQRQQRHAHAAHPQAQAPGRVGAQRQHVHLAVSYTHLDVYKRQRIDFVEGLYG